MRSLHILCMLPTVHVEC